MSVKLGSTDASLYLGSTPVAAYLGAVQVYSASATLYFNAAVDTDWATVGNWWLDAAGTEPAGRLPASVDSAVVLGAVYTSASPVVLASLTVSSSDEFYGQYTVLGSTSFTDNSVNFAQITGNATFNDTSTNGGTVTGNATFNDSSQNYGNVTGTATFTGSACNDEGTAGTFVPDPPPSCP